MIHCKPLNSYGRHVINGIHAAFTGRIGGDAEGRGAHHPR
jgi:hypothetical protein